MNKNSEQVSLDNISIHAWMNTYGISNEKGDRIEFKDHLFLFDIYTDLAPNLCVMKAAQVGASTMEIVKNIYDARRQKMDIIYTLPTDNDVQLFVGGKVNRIIANNPVLQSYTTDKDTIEQKKIANSMVYFRGTWTSRSAIMITADRLVHDEIDSSKQDIVKEYQARLQHSKFKQVHVFSHPSVPGFGVDVFWKLSDQKHWNIICPWCLKEHYMEWPGSFNLDTKKYVCKLCGGELRDSDRKKGRWIPKFPGEHKYSGYWIPLFITPWTSAEEIIDKYHDPKITEEFFYNKVLGLPYAGSGNTVSQETIFQNLTDKINTQEGRVVIGVDTGKRIHYVMGNREGIFHYGELKRYDELEEFLHRYPRSIIVADQGGDIIGIRELKEKYPGRVFLCFYRKDRKTNQLIRWGQNQEFGTVIADRNRLISLMIGEFGQKRIPLFGTENEFHDYYLHWSHIYRAESMNNLGIPEFKWERSDEDHYVHASVYWLIGISKYGEGGGVFGEGLETKSNSFEIKDGKGPLPDTKSILDKIFNKISSEWR